jgi:hemerythrin-like domain-containing protein
MDVCQLLRLDHQNVLELFEELQRTPARPEKARSDVYEELRRELLAHAQAEQEIFYAALLNRVPDRDLILEAFEEHGVVERMFKDIDACPVSDEKWLAKVSVLREIVEHHIEEEENELFKTAREVLSRAEAEAIAEEVEARKAELDP